MKQSLPQTVSLPTHVGIILDGNRRWAKERGLLSVEGHKKGADVLCDIAVHCFDMGIPYMTAYVFSTENWQRDKQEVSFIMRLLVNALKKNYIKKFQQNNLKVVMIGSLEGVSEEVADAIHAAEEATKNNTRGVLGLCFNYGGQQEIVNATKSLIEKNIPADQVTIERLQQELPHPEIPDLDLLIRTSGEQRLSGFMLYRAAYAELYFTNTFWPDFDAKHFDDAITEYAHRHRRFGA